MIDNTTAMLERIPPQNIEAEQAALGAMLLEREAIARAVELVRAEDFYREAHRTIYHGIIDLFNRNEPVDLITLGEWLKSREQLDAVGGALYLTTIMSQVPTAAGIGNYATIIRNKSLQRQLIKAADEIMAASYQGDRELEELVDESEQKIFAIAERNLTSGFVSLQELVKQQFYHIEDTKISGLPGTGLNTGFSELDAITAGLQPSDMIVLAARPSMGKTALALNIARNVAVSQQEQNTVAVFSLEMSKEQIALRLLCSEARVTQDNVRHAMISDEDMGRLAQAVETLWNCPIYIDDTPSISVLEIRGKARRLKAEHGLGLIVVDYLQLMNSPMRAENRVQEIAIIARGLKALAREMKVPVIACSQLSRMVEQRSPRRPQLSDLRECVTGDTLVQLVDGRRLPIRDLEGSTPDVWAVTPEGMLTTAQSEKIWKVGRRQTVRLRLASGRTIQATPEHRLLMLDGWMLIAQMNIGDRLAIPRRIPEPRQTGTWSDDRVSFSPSRAVAAEYATLLTDPILRRQAENDLSWDRIVAIEPAGEEDVYDLTVPCLSSWIANGIVSHNSGAIEQDADLVLFIYRPEYYGEEELLRIGWDPERDKHVAEILVAKQRNGPTGTIKLVWVPEYGQFGDLAQHR